MQRFLIDETLLLIGIDILALAALVERASLIAVQFALNEWLYIAIGPFVSQTYL